MNKDIRNSILQKPFLFFFILFFVVFPQNAFAYLDFYTGSYFLQLLLGGIFGALFAIKVYWKKIKTFFVQIFSKKKDASQHEDQL
jgi:hypothetical protein